MPVNLWEKVTALVCSVLFSCRITWVHRDCCAKGLQAWETQTETCAICLFWLVSAGQNRAGSDKWRCRKMADESSDDKYDCSWRFCAASFAAFKDKVLEACGLASLKNVQFNYLYNDLTVQLCSNHMGGIHAFLKGTNRLYRFFEAGDLVKESRRFLTVERARQRLSCSRPIIKVSLWIIKLKQFSLKIDSWKGMEHCLYTWASKKVKGRSNERASNWAAKGKPV